MTANLQPGEYDMTCGLLTNPKGKLIVKGEATADAAQSDALLSLGGAITAYKAYVMAETTQLVTDTKAFTDAIKAGDIEKRKHCMRRRGSTMSASNRLLNCSPIWMAALTPVKMITSKSRRSKIHRFPPSGKALFGDNTTKGMDKYADQLYTDVVDLQKRISELAFPPSKVVGGAAGLIEEVAASKISGEEDRYSHTDLWDFQANVEGSQKIVDLLRPQLQKRIRNCWQKSMPTSKGRYHSGEIPH
ncbi:iron uptake system protein EfeO [Escherichia coli]|nr:iron uptake system protein EfeO [Escherichia coli]MCW7036696.1 iron uptake system protein EfeO [Escherichia coli]